MSDHRQGRRERLPSEEELALWRAAMRDIVPWRPEAVEPAPAAPPEAPVPTAPQAAGELPRARRVRLVPAPRRLDPHRPVDLDRRTWQRLRRGRMPIEGRIDLHGMTQEEAHRALDAFLHRMHANGARCVLVITGRGARSGGVLRRSVPHWLEAPGLRGIVLAFGQARIEHGGEGALYVLLRRRARTSTGD